MNNLNISPRGQEINGHLWDKTNQNLPSYSFRSTVKMAAFKLLDRVMPKIVSTTGGAEDDDDVCELPFRLVRVPLSLVVKLVSQ